LALAVEHDDRRLIHTDHVTATGAGWHRRDVHHERSIDGDRAEDATKPVLADRVKRGEISLALATQHRGVRILGDAHQHLVSTRPSADASPNPGHP
jgi:hypothetical protein